jgi:TonB family protein
VQIYFRIRRDGSIDGERVESPSGNSLMDQSALLAVRRSNPLPRLPEGFDSPSLGVRFWFTYLGN